NLLPQFHERLVEVTGALGGDELFGQLPEVVFGGGLGDVSGQVGETAEDADDVAIQHGGWLVERYRGDGSGGVAADAFKFHQVGGGCRETAVPLLNHHFCRHVQIAGAAVVAQAFPQLQHVVQGR